MTRILKNHECDDPLSHKLAVTNTTTQRQRSNKSCEGKQR